MKYNNIKIALYSLLIVFFFGLSACDRYLDDMPDNRAEMRGPKEIKDILVSAYTNLHPQLILEKMSDNVMDNGILYGTEDKLNQSMYFWEDTSERSWDSPYLVWVSSYLAIANANLALETMEALGFPEETRGSRAEALLCRAYHHFLLSNVFCMAYNEETAAQHMGIPFVIKPEKEVGAQYERGTLEELYDKINDDIENALTDVAYLTHEVPLYHFNKNAAYAFAARFNLFYKKNPETLEKVIKYASEVLGDNPGPMLRNLDDYSSYTNALEWTYGYINKTERSNLLLIANRSRWGNQMWQKRYAHSRLIANAGTFWSNLPAGGTAVYKSVFGNDQCLVLPKMSQIFEYTNLIARSGQPHVVVMAFTTDETLLCRAEAYTLLNRFDEATNDLKAWYRAKRCPNVEFVTKEIISKFYSADDAKDLAKPLNPLFTINPGMQTGLLQAVLHARRIEGIHEGTRFIDIKRYGIEIKHNKAHEQDLVLKPHDLRTAVQIPKTVHSAGIPNNPR